MKVCCPKCGGGLVIESTGQYGVIRKIGPTGKIHKKRTKVLYGLDGAYEDMVYCTSCGYGVGTDFNVENGVLIPDWEVEA